MGTARLRPRISTSSTTHRNTRTRRPGVRGHAYLRARVCVGGGGEVSQSGQEQLGDKQLRQQEAESPQRCSSALAHTCLVCVGTHTHPVCQHLPPSPPPPPCTHSHTRYMSPQAPPLTCRRAGRGMSRCAAFPQQWLQGQQGAPQRHHQADGCTAHSRHEPQHGSVRATHTHTGTWAHKGDTSQ